MTCKDCSGVSGIALVLLTQLACSILIATPASAVTQHLGDGPSFTAMLAGNNEFVPGADTTITLLVKNTGLNAMKQVAMGTIEPEDQQNTAKTITISLASAGDAVIIKTDPQMVGDIRGGNSVTVHFRAKISENATEGEYQLPLTLQYRYLRVIVQEKADVFEFTYNEARDTLPITLRIKPRVKAEVIEAVPEGLTVGSDGFLNLKVKNAGLENGTMASVKLLRNEKSPIIPTDSTLFIGDFPSGSIVAGRYKVSVSKDATNQTYPVDLVVSYTNREGTMVTSSVTTVGVPVNAKPAFSVISAVPEVPGGTGKVIEVQYRNDGNVMVYAAQARLALHDPVPMGDNTAYLGDIAPGESEVARFNVQADGAADPGVYSFDSTIRYRDVSGTSLESDTIPVQLNVMPAAGGISALAIAGCIIVIIVICVVFLVYRQKNKSR
ncbi:MAG: S-layer protein [Methanoregula sp.]|nr:S-layer protein [Methanoregula sp.]